MKFPKIDRFVLALAAAVILAIIWPEPGRTHGMLQWQWITTYGICGVFFLYGLTLKPERMREGLMCWKAHLVIVFTTFGLFPLVVLLGLALAPDAMPEAAKVGFFYIAALPSTVSSSVAMVSLARGNIPVAIFNATLSSLLGVFLTPTLMAWYLKTAGTPIDLRPTIIKIVLLVLLPIVVGQVARRWLSDWAQRHNSFIKQADRAIILAIVYGAFCDSVVEGVWVKHDVLVVVKIAVGTVLLFTVIYALMLLITKLFKFETKERIAVLFCGSKKSLATGVPLAPLIFAGRGDIGLTILPIMLFHFFQLLIVAFLAARYGERDELKAAAVAHKKEA